MKKCMLIVCLFFAELSAMHIPSDYGMQGRTLELRFDADGNAYDLNFDVQEDTFHFIESFCGLLFARDSGDITADHIAWNIVGRNNYDFEKMESDFAQVGGGFQYTIYKRMLDAADFDAADNYIKDTVIHPAVSMKAIFITGDKKLEMRESLIRSTLVDTVDRGVINKSRQVDNEVVVEPKDTGSKFGCVLSSPLFKASCTATVTGVVTYCALRFYNKDKAKEQRYSPIQWSLGAATVVGLGTYWYVQ